VTAVGVVLTAAAIGAAVALTSPGSAGAAPVPGHGAATVPASIVPSGPRPHTNTAVIATASLASFNWGGYVASGATYSKVTSSWIQPRTSCSTNGVVSFWVGLDGWGDQTVEQTGTGVDCRTGTPQYYAWWETWPTNNQQTYTATPVAPGDHITATVAVTGTQYALTLVDSTQGWTRNTTAAAPAGATNASAEIVAEAASVNGAISPLPDFDAVPFSASTIDDGTLQLAGAQAVDMINSARSPIGTTGTADDTGAFTVTYTGGAGDNVLGAFQHADGSLHTYTASGDTPQAQAVAAGTSPSITPLPAGYETAFQGTNGNLWVSGPGGVADTGFGMLAGTSPAITATSAGAFQVAFQSNTGSLWVYSSDGTATSLGLGMYPGTSPAITTLAGGRVQIAFEANTGNLWTTAAARYAARDLRLGMATGTNPSIAGLAGGGYVIAVQANTASLWMYASGPNAARSQGLGMAAGTSPSVAASSGGGYAVAFEANTQVLWTATSTTTAANATGGHNMALPMMPGTNPSMVAVPGGWETAYETPAGDFAVTGAAGDTDTQQAMAQGTNPDIAP
jgi:hypothetical protein